MSFSVCGKLAAVQVKQSQNKGSCVRIDFSGFDTAYQYVYQIAGQLAQHTVKWIDKASVYVQYPPISYLALISANILFFEVALSICRLTNCIFNCCRTKDEDLQHREQRWRSIGLGMLFIATVVGTNVVFCRALRVPLSCWKVVAVSCGTHFTYLCIRSY